MDYYRSNKLIGGTHIPFSVFVETIRTRLPIVIAYQGVTQDNMRIKKIDNEGGVFSFTITDYNVLGKTRIIHQNHKCGIDIDMRFARAVPEGLGKPLDTDLHVVSIDIQHDDKKDMTLADVDTCIVLILQSLGYFRDDRY